jgi:hypothetical protein
MILKWVKSRWLKHNVHRLLEAIHQRPQERWPAIKHLWRNARQVAVDGIGASNVITAETKVLNEIVALGTRGEQFLVGHISDPNANIAAYCLLGLSLMGYWVDHEPPEDLLARTDLVVVQWGCLVNKTALGTLAASERSRAKGPGQATRSMANAT